MDYSEKHESDAAYMPTPEEIKHMARLIRQQNEAARQGKKPQPEVDPDTDAELEEAADQAARRSK